MFNLRILSRFGAARVARYWRVAQGLMVRRCLPGLRGLDLCIGFGEMFFEQSC